MGTKALRLLLMLLCGYVVADGFVSVDRQKITLNRLFTRSCYPSIHFARQQIERAQMEIELELNGTEEAIPCDVGTSVKVYFDMINRTFASPSSVFLTDACQNVLSYVAEVATYLHLPVFSFTDTDLSLSSTTRYPFVYHMVPSDRAHNLVRKQLLEYFNWTRFGLIYQHGSKYTLVANDFSDLTTADKKSWEMNLTRGISYRHGAEWRDDNRKNMKALLEDFKARDVRIIIANFNQTIATHMFCHAARERAYGSRYQWILLGYPSLSAWWTEDTDCTKQEIIRAINGTFQTRVPRLSIDDTEERPEHVLEYLEHFSELERDYFDAYAYDTIWSLAYIYQSKVLFSQSDIKRIVDKIDFIGATGRVRYLNGRRVGEILVEQYVACRIMKDGSCKIPCYAEEKNCSLTVVKLFLAKNPDFKNDPTVLYELNPVIWHGNSPTRDRTDQIVQFEHIYLSAFISVSITSVFGLMVSISLFIFNIRFQSHRYIRMSSPSLNNIILCGCMLAYTTTILMGVNSSLFSSKPSATTVMNVICAARAWLLCISFTLAFGSMFSKTWRVHSLFTNINSTKRAIHDSRLLAVVGALLCTDVVLLVAWQIFDPIRRKIVHDIPHPHKYNEDIQVHPYHEICRGRFTPFWLLSLVLYKGLLIFCGSFLSWKTRHVTIPALNDSRYIGLSVYMVFICCTLGSLVAFIPSEQIQLSYFLTSLCIIICTTATLGFVFVPKVIEVYRDPYARRRPPKTIGRLIDTSLRPMIATTRQLNTAIVANHQLNYALSMQEQTLQRLTKQLQQCSLKNKTLVERRPSELERLVTPNDAIVEEEGDDDSTDCFLPDKHQAFQGHLTRATSSCLYNKNHRTQICSPEAGHSMRASISYIEDNHRSAPMVLSVSADLKSLDQTFQLFKTISSSSESEPEYDGLITLDDNRLRDMRETDLITTHL